MNELAWLFSMERKNGKVHAIRRHVGSLCTRKQPGVQHGSITPDLLMQSLLTKMESCSMEGQTWT